MLLPWLQCSAADPPRSATPVLQGQVEHHEQLPPLESDLQEGSNFSESAVQRRAKYAGKWIRIPAWFAGTFQTNETYLESAFDYATGKQLELKRVVPSVGTEQRGQQKDNTGAIWHYYVESGSSKSEQTSHVTYSTIDWYGPEVIANDRVVMRIQATSLVVDKNTGTIVDSFQREDLKTYVPQKGGIAVRYTSKSFDSRGHARDLQTGRSVHKRVAPFEVIDHAGDINYKGMFYDFLESNHLSKLLPSSN